LKNQNITVFGTGKQSRCFLYVKDAVSGMIRLMKHPEAVGQVFNLGSQEEITIQCLAEEVIRLTGSRSQIIYVPYDEAYEDGFEDMQRRIPDITKASRLVDFKPTASLKEILQMVVAEFREKFSHQEQTLKP